MTDLISQSEAARIAGVNRATIHRRIAEGVIPVYRSDLDRKTRYIRRSDLERLMTIKPVEEQRPAAAVAA